MLFRGAMVLILANLDFYRWGPAEFREPVTLHALQIVHGFHRALVTVPVEP